MRARSQICVLLARPGRLFAAVSGAAAEFAVLTATGVEPGPLVCAGGLGEGQSIVSVESPDLAPRGDWWVAVAAPTAPRYRYTVRGMCGDTVDTPEPCPVGMVFDATGYRGIALAPSAAAAARAAARICQAAMEKDYGGPYQAFAVKPACAVRQSTRCRRGGGSGAE
jgi:hypothetical protein